MGGVIHLEVRSEGLGGVRQLPGLLCNIVQEAAQLKTVLLLNFCQWELGPRGEMQHR